MSSGHEQVERAPHPLLAGSVRRYCGYDHGGSGSTRRREVAQDEVTLILSLGAPLRIGGPDQPEDWYGSFVAALKDTFAITEHRGRLRGIEVNLSPLGAHMLFGVAMHSLSERLVVPLDDVLGSAARGLVERLETAPGWDARFAILDRFFLRRFERNDRGRFAEIAQRCGYYDQAHMNREFRELAGTAPGEFVARLLPDGLGVAAD